MATEFDEMVSCFDVHVTYPNGSPCHAQIRTTMSSVELHRELERLIPFAEDIRVTYDE